MNIKILGKNKPALNIMWKLSLMVITILVIILAIPIVIFFVVYWIIKTIILLLLIRLNWHPKKKFMLFVYSDSPKWKSYVETKSIQKLLKYSEVVNFSERKKWKKYMPFKVKVFRHFTGVWSSIVYKESCWKNGKFSPVAVIFIPWWNPKIVSFREAFKHIKIGDTSALNNAISKISNLIQSVN